MQLSGVPRWSWERRLLANAILALPFVLVVEAATRAARGNLWAAPLLGVVVMAYVAAVIGDIPERTLNNNVHQTRTIPLNRLVKVASCPDAPAVALTLRASDCQTVALLWPSDGTGHGIQRLLEAFLVARARSAGRSRSSVGRTRDVGVGERR